MADQPEGPPPPYETLNDPIVARRTPVSVVGNEGAPNNHLEPSEDTPMLEPQHQRQTEQSFSLEKFIFLWLGIGRCYSGCCLLIFMLLFAWGVSVIVVALVVLVIDTPVKNCREMLPSLVITCVTGLLFILLGGYWPISYGWMKRQGSNNFTLLGTYAWVLSLMFFAVIVAFGLELVEHYQLLLPLPCYQYTPPCGKCNGSNDIEFYVPLAALSSAVVVTVVFVLFSLFCLCCASRRVIGRIC